MLELWRITEGIDIPFMILNIT